MRTICIVTVFLGALSGCAGRSPGDIAADSVTVTVASATKLIVARGGCDPVSLKTSAEALHLKIAFQSEGKAGTYQALLGPQSVATVNSTGEMMLDSGWLYIRGMRPWGRTARASGGVSGFVVDGVVVLAAEGPGGSGAHRVFFVSGVSASAQAGTSPETTWTDKNLYGEQVGTGPIQLKNLNADPAVLNWLAGVVATGQLAGL